MKSLLFLLLSVVFCSLVVDDVTAQIFPDVPPPSGQTRPPNMLPFKAGSLIIDMGDRQIEGTSVHGKSVAGLFNLHAYGYAVHLLHNGVPLFWAIRSNKAMDEADFTASTQRVHPASAPSGYDAIWGPTTEQNNAFKAGPLIIRPQFADQALQVLETLKSQQTDGGGRFQSIVIHRLLADTSLDIRHIILHKPHVFVSIISGLPSDYQPQSLLFAHVGLRQGTVEQGGMYELVDEGTRIEDFNENTCHTLFTEPHIIYDIDSEDCPRCLPTVPQYREALFKFINSGGNFAAQCAGVTSYENSLWASQYHPEAGVEGAFLSKYGIKGLGNRGNEWGGRSDDASLRFPNPDLPAVQFVGRIQGQAPGTISEWYLLGSGDESSLFKNNGHSLVENAKTGQAFINTQTAHLKPCGPCGDTQNNTLPANRRAFMVTGAKIGSYTNGGMVFYIGAHSWWQDLSDGAGWDASTPSGKVESAGLINGRRIILNAMLTPSTRPAHCLLNLCPEDFECPSKESLGTCQRCECVDGEESITTDPTMCGSCELCIDNYCVRNDSLCGTCEECRLDNTDRHQCVEIENENCTKPSEGLTPEEKGGIAAAVIGGTLGAVFGAAAVGVGVGIGLWKLLKKPPQPPTIDGVENMEAPEVDVNDNKMWDDPVKVYDSQL